VATVIATRRSAPRPVGAKFAVSESGEMAGSVSGGCVESDVYEHACQVLEGARPQFLSYGIADELAFSVGLPCGGEIDVFVESAPDELVERLLKIIETEERAILFTVVEGEPLGAELLVTESGDRFGEGPEELDGGGCLDARRQVRRACAPGGAGDGGVLHRRARLAAKPGTPARAPARSRCRGAGVRARLGADGARHRRRQPGGDRAFDPRRDPRHSRGPGRRLPAEFEDPHPRGGRPCGSFASARPLGTALRA